MIITHNGEGKVVLQGENMVERWRKLMGTTNPNDVDRGTIRGDMGTDIERNVVHGSDSKDNAIYEINYFFKGNEIFYKNIKDNRGFLKGIDTNIQSENGG